MNVAPRRAAVLGHPVAHSLSPVLHTAAYRALGLEGWDYAVHDVTEETLAGFLGDIERAPGRDWAGLSLTMPLKQAVIPLLDHVEPLAAAVGAVNTVLFAAVGGVVTTTGTNTDVHGIVAALREGLGTGPGERPVAEAVVLGGGATAASALAALAELGCPSARVFVRSLDRIGPLREAVARMGVSPSFEVFDDAATTAALVRADAVVSTTPKYAADVWAKLLTDGAVLADGALLTDGVAVPEGSVPPDGSAVPDGTATSSDVPHGVLLDVVYDPRPTALQSAWTALGAPAVGGERMLLHQAAEQVRLMTGRAAPLEAMDQALRAALLTPAR
ncbi:shikimate dehydrogenase [Promicromonospora sukumoe]|uniref:Shikimate dehydrogenase n=1 Tax=Promicromonospora sukumoe TaxID=88382 RepID=A0A7W3PDV2_9MICO|nr:shikimate dehydrogenase [Promicromonospora sukumoe]MBA8807942.1 shikimate dehydrogenase [Promicromonospora sukumoe]